MYSIAFYALRCYLPEPNSGSICFKHHMSKNWFSNSFMYGFMVNNFKPSWYTKLVGGFNPSEKSSSNWKSSASFREKINIFWNHPPTKLCILAFFPSKKKTQLSKQKHPQWNFFRKSPPLVALLWHHLSVFSLRGFPKIRPWRPTVTRFFFQLVEHPIAETAQWHAYISYMETWKKIPKTWVFTQNAPEKMDGWKLEDEIGFFWAYFQGRSVNFRSVGLEAAQIVFWPIIQSQLTTTGLNLVGGWTSHFNKYS